MVHAVSCPPIFVHSHCILKDIHCSPKEYRRVGWSVSCKDGRRLIDLIVTLLIKLLLIVDTFSLAAILK